MATKFIILSTQRSGSTYLSYLLHSHPAVCVNGEMYHHTHISGAPGRPKLHNFFTFQLRNTLPVFFLNYFALTSPQPASVTGCRIMYDQLAAFSPLENYVSTSTAIKIIHLKRKNLFESFVSFQLASRSGSWVTFNQPYRAEPPLVVSPKKCLRYFKTVTKLRDAYDLLFARHETLEVWYEDLQNDPTFHSNRIFDFFGIQRKSVTSPTKKQSLQPVHEIVSNFSALRKFFAKSQWEHFFEHTSQKNAVLQ